MNAPHALRIFRENRDLSQKAVAKAGGLSSWLLSRIESGRVNPSLSEARKIAKGMGVGVEDVTQCLKAQGSHLWERRVK